MKNMRKLFYLITACFVLICISCKDKHEECDDFKLDRGVNISHWLSQSNVRGKARADYFTEKDVAYIASEGFDHLRIPIDEEQMFFEDGEKDTEAFALLHDALTWCRKYNLRAVVDLHILRSHYFNADVKPLFTEVKAQEAFYECWRKISSELHTYSNGWVAYELMNEPVADKSEDWNHILNKCIETIRGIISFHYYHPFLFTHYKASWTPEVEYTGAVHYPGNVVLPEDLALLSPEIAGKYESWTHEIYNKDVFAENFEEVLQVARLHGLKVYCGEYGCINSSPVPDRIRWWRDINEVFTSKGIARAVWDYKGGFGIIKQGVPDRDMIDALMGVGQTDKANQ